MYERLRKELIITRIGDDLELLKHPRVYALADMFRIEDLKSLSSEKFQLQLKQHWISDTMADCIREVYSTSTDIKPSAMRQAVVDTASLHRKDLVQKRSIQELIREVGDFAIDLISAILSDEGNMLTQAVPIASNNLAPRAYR